MVHELKGQTKSDDEELAGQVVEMRGQLLNDLIEIVKAMNMDNFIVRTERRLVEKYQQAGTWANLSGQDYGELIHHIADLPSQLIDSEEEAKHFDLLMFRVKLSILRGEKGYVKLRERVMEIAGLLEEITLDLVQREIELITELQTDEWWQDATMPMLNNARLKLRGLVRLIEFPKRKPVYTDFQDEMVGGAEVELPGFSAGVAFKRFKEKARMFLLDHEDHIAIRKVRDGLPLNQTDLAELQNMLVDAGIGTADEVQQAALENKSLGMFIRSMVGMNREAAKRAFGSFIEDTAATADQIEFIDMIIDHLTENGVMEPRLLYESPYTDLSPRGPEGVFSTEQIDGIIAILNQIRRSVAA